MKQQKLKALAAGIIALSSSYVMAIPTFSFTEVAGFEIGDVNSTIVMHYNAPIAASANNPAGSVTDQISWYEQNDVTDRSSLKLANPNQPVVWNPLDWVVITTLTHVNEEITGLQNGWFGQDVLGRLKISDEGGVVLDDTDGIKIDLLETTNSAPCATNFTNTPTPCEDVFTFTAAGLTPLDFTATDGTLWTVLFDLDPTNASFFDGVDKVYTEEFATSSLDVRMKLQQRPSTVPEPATLGILGLGLLGLGIAKRRKLNA